MYVIRPNMEHIIYTFLDHTPRKNSTMAHHPPRRKKRCRPWGGTDFIWNSPYAWCIWVIFSPDAQIPTKGVRIRPLLFLHAVCCQCNFVTVVFARQAPSKIFYSKLVLCCSVSRFYLGCTDQFNPKTGVPLSVLNFKLDLCR